jgi:hypothetical protein
MKDLIQLVSSSVALPKQYEPMLDSIRQALPAVYRATQHHGKSHTQFQNFLLDNAGPVAGPTKLRNARQLLAVINHTEDALTEAYFRRKRDKARLDELSELKNPTVLERIRAEELQSKLLRSQRNVEGAIRKLAAYIEQYRHLENQIREELQLGGNDPITEAHLEADEERFHIMKAFEQALIAARINNGRIDHGNMIYLHDLGIGGYPAQREIVLFLNEENQYAVIHKGSIHDFHRREHEFLVNMAKLFHGCSKVYASRKGLHPGYSPQATLTNGQNKS